LFKVKEAADRTASTNNLHQIGIAVHNCNDTYGAMIPPIAGKFPGADGPEGSILFHLLPFVEQLAVYHMGENGLGVSIKTFLCPLDRSAQPGDRHEGFALSSYAGNALVFVPGAGIPRSFPDGTSNTLMFTTRYQMCNGTPNAWGYPSLYAWSPQVDR